MLSLKLGDMILMGVGIVAMLMMIIVGPGKRDLNDPEAERRSNAAYLRLFSDHLSPILVVALIFGLAGVAYVLLAVYLKTL